MSSSVMEFAVEQQRRSDGGDGGDRADNERLDLLLQSSDPTAQTISFPTETFLRAALLLKDQVVEATWKGGGSGSGAVVLDPTAYTGLLGTAFTCLRSYEVTRNRQDLLTCAEIVDTCATVARASTRHVTFLCGRGGVYALGAVVYNHIGDHHKRDFFLGLFLELAEERALPAGPEEGGFGMSYDLLYGRAGFLWAALFLNHHLGHGSVPDDLLSPIVAAVVAGGRVGAADNEACPLLYRFHGTRYWGAANGLAGILHVFLHFRLSEEDANDVKGTLRYMMSNRFPQSGNYPCSEGNPRDKLVQWAHGATCMAITLSKASQVFPNEREFRDAAIEAGEVVWNNGLVKKVGLADGVAGNAYAFLSLFRLTGDRIYEERAIAFASYLCHNARDLVENSEHAYSLFRGLAGAACLWFDLVRPESSRFPGYEI
ncbi:PREDICTED: lanC-like protein GCL1 [Tarenaya hassleriana]|uniref:lanC-like protein GCL1 n=1 Tax=Tarenaya hassleriana TaxID=28532 RepID=UPI00053C3F75|nr:PREDICTED: lanC-like protein GCL1 [Tarenaya hassleriana]